jgi:hypothetical protein
VQAAESLSFAMSVTFYVRKVSRKGERPSLQSLIQGLSESLCFIIVVWQCNGVAGIYAVDGTLDLDSCEICHMVMLPWDDIGSFKRR